MRRECLTISVNTGAISLDSSLSTLAGKLSGPDALPTFSYRLFSCFCTPPDDIDSPSMGNLHVALMAWRMCLL